MLLDMRFILSTFVALSLTACGAAYDTADTADIDLKNGDECMPSRSLFGQTVHWPDSAPAGTTATVLNVANPVTTCEGTPTTWGVQVQLTFNQGTLINLGDKIRFYAQVTWGVLGGSFTAQIDVTGGASFNLVADSVRVDIIDASTFVAGPPATSIMSVSGSATPTPVPKVIQTTRTIELSAFAPLPANDTVAIVPPFAKRLSIARYDASLANSGYTVRFYSLTLDVLASVDIGAGGELEDYPIPGNTSFVALSAVGADITALSYIFGIDF